MSNVVTEASMKEEPKDDKSYVFVYGTLLKGFGNHEHLLARDPIHSDCFIVGRMVSLGGFPGAIDIDVADRHIKGEVYEVTPFDLKRLDRLEGYRGPDSQDNMYNRVLVDVIINLPGGGEQILEEVYTYEWNNKYGYGKDIVPSGSWREHIKERDRRYG